MERGSREAIKAAVANNLSLGPHFLCHVLVDVKVGRLPRTEILHRIADRCEVSLTWLLTGKGQEKVTVRIAEQPESYRRVGKKERKLRKTFNELLESNDKKILDLLSKQIDLLAELMESRKRKKK